MWTGLWQKRSKFTETNTAIAYEQHGFFEQAQTAYEQVSFDLLLTREPFFIEMLSTVDSLLYALSTYCHDSTIFHQTQTRKFANVEVSS